MLKYLKKATAYTSISAGFISGISIGIIRHFRLEGYEIKCVIDLIAIGLPVQIGVVGIDTIKAAMESQNIGFIGFEKYFIVLTRLYIYILSAFISCALFSTYIL